VTILTPGVRAAALLVDGFDIHRATPVLGSLGCLEHAVLPLSFPVLHVHLLDSAVEVLDVDRAVVVIDGDDLEQLAAAEAIPQADIRMRSRHRTYLLKARSLCCVRHKRATPLRGSEELICSAREHDKERYPIRLLTAVDVALCVCRFQSLIEINQRLSGG